MGRIVVTDSTGRRTALDDVAMIEPPSAMLIGNAAGGVTGAMRYAGPARACTLFNSPGQGIKLAPIRAVPPGMAPIICVKDPYVAPAPAGKPRTVGNDLDDLLATLATPAALVPHHEPEADGPADVFRANAQAYADAIEAHPNGHLLDLGCKLLGYSEEHGAHPDDWIIPAFSWIGWDNYTQATSGGYPAPATWDMFQLMLSVGAQHGKPVALTEFNALRQTQDPTGAGRAAWMADVVAALLDEWCIAALIWDGLGTPNKTYPSGIPFGPFALTSPEYAVWRALSATAH